jgi:diaminopimelate decarboxylase
MGPGMIETLRHGVQHERQEALKAMPYMERMAEKYKGLRFWEYLNYDEEGDLYLRGLRVLDIIGSISEATHNHHPGTPLKIDNPEIMTQRAQEFIQLAERVKKSIGYRGGIKLLYATKASFEATSVVAAYAGGANIETSSEQDLENIRRLNAFGKEIISKNTTIVCNGFKPNPNRLDSLPRRVVKKIHRVIGEVGDTIHNTGQRYAEMIIKMRKDGYKNIVPIFDSVAEVGYLKRSGLSINCGLRFKAYDAAKYDADYDHLVARHGTDRAGMFEAAEAIAKTKNLTLTTFHAMVGANEMIPMDKHIDALMKAAELFFELKKKYPTLHVFNMGGGLRPFGTSRYNHAEFINQFLSGLTDMAKKFGQPVPDVQFELGSLLAAEGKVAAAQIQEIKINNVELNGEKIPWLIPDVSFMRLIPDNLLIGDKSFIVIAANYGNMKARKFRLGGITCDHDDYLRTDADPVQMTEENTILLPDITELSPEQLEQEPLIIFFVALGAYEEELTSPDGTGHCQIAVPINVTFKMVNGEPIFYLKMQKGPSQTSQDLGFSDPKLRPILEQIAHQR